MMKKYIIAGITLLIIFTLGYFFAIKTIEPETITEISVDTLYIPSKPIVKWETAYITTIILDTLIITNVDTFFINDTIKVAEDEVDFKEGHLGVQYYFPPVNSFSYHWNPYPVPIIYQKETITVVKKLKWYEKPKVWAFVGFVTGFIVAKQ